jgi:hypothetical protein
VNGLSKSISYKYIDDGYSSSGRKLPDLPVVTLLLRRRDRRLQAKGLAIVDTGFDGSVYPSISLLKLLEGMKPRQVEYLFHPLYARIDCEVYELDAFLLNGSEQVSLGQVLVYAPTDPDYISDEVLIGREILNNHKILLNGPTSTLNIEYQSRLGSVLS